MRLWSINPKYLDTKGLITLWREGLSAKAVLEGGRIGYTKHPQLTRFYECSNPVEAIKQYMQRILFEGKLRGYKFDGSKIGNISTVQSILVTEGQLLYETQLLAELLVRAPGRVPLPIICEPHSMFKVIPGEVELWERVK